MYTCVSHFVGAKIEICQKMKSDVVVVVDDDDDDGGWMMGDNNG